MTTTITIHDQHGDDQRTVSVGLTDSSARLARRKFNPSGDARVDTIKALVAALYTLMDEVQRDVEGLDDVQNQTAKREAAIAKTQLQGAAMFAVSAATAKFA